MLRLLTFFLIVCLGSCIDSEYSTDPMTEPSESVDEVAQTYETTLYSKEEAWVCNHPGTSMHDKECIEEIYPDGCYVSGDNTKFCWLLVKQECENPDVHPEVQGVCHLLK